MASNPLIPGKRPIVTDEVELADPWKVKPAVGGLIRSGAFTGSGRGGGGSTGGSDKDPEEPKGARPSLTDISVVSQTAYYDAAGMVRIKVKFRVYNSSGESIEKFAVAYSLSENQGGTS